MQLFFVALLNAQLANHLGAPVVGIVIAVFQRLLFALVDAADIAHHMARHIFQRVIAEKAGLDIHPGKAPALRGKARHFLIAQAAAQRNRFKALGVVHQPLELAPVAGGDFHQLRQLLDGGFQILHLGARNLQRVG